jgi:hypothetical protein
VTIARAPRAPFALEPTPFPFPNLASLAGRAGMGGPREVALACLVVGRLVAETCAPGSILTADQRRTRAHSARQWLAAAALAAGMRAALGRLADATTDGDPDALKDALESVITVTASQLEQGSRLELARLAQAIVA